MVEKGTTRSSDTAHPIIQKVLASKPPIAELIGFSVDTIESLRPRAVVAGHKRPERDDDPRIIEETRQYILDFDRIAETAETALQLYERMLARHAHRVNPGMLWWSARVLKG